MNPFQSLDPNSSDQAGAQPTTRRAIACYLGWKERGIVKIPAVLRCPPVSCKRIMGEEKRTQYRAATMPICCGQRRHFCVVSKGHSLVPQSAHSV